MNNSLWAINTGVEEGKITKYNKAYRANANSLLDIWNTGQKLGSYASISDWDWVVMI